MQCSQCGTANAEGMKFCGECGAVLAVICPACGFTNRDARKFCGECGSGLRISADTPPLAGSSSTGVPASPTPVAERRVCSVLFCDLVGFTPLSEARDPEEVRELLSRYFEVARTVIGRYGGAVEKFIGDAVMAVWGTPMATEEDAERAVRAALELVDAVAQLGREAGAEGLAARAGIVTGPVAVTVGATGEGMVAGDAVNTAARVQSAAEPGAVLVDENTWRVVHAAVAFTSVGTHALKGKAEPMALWQVERVLSGVGGAQRVDGLEAPFVGRDAELRLVKELFHACVERRSPRLMSVTGAAGVGKSRLGWEFEKYVDGLADTVHWHRGRCLSYGEGVAFWALAEMVRQRLQIAEEDSAAAAADKLTAGLERWLTDPDQREYVGLRLGQLLGVDLGAGGPTFPREELFAGWRLFFERLAAVAPVVLVVEDLHHGDPGFLDFVEHMLDWARGVPIFVLTFARPEVETRRAGWGAGRRNSTALTLDALDDTAMGLLLEGLVPGMPPSAKAAIAARAEGVPLYAVETVRMLIDRDVVQPVEGVYRLIGDVGELGVPDTLQSLLAARLDALEPSARSLVSDAAVLGTSFPVEALTAVSGRDETDVRKQLAELVHREVLGVRADPLSPERGHYGFVQTMFRQVAYDTLSRRERKARHLAVAAHLQTAFAEGGEEIAEVIAAHLLDALNAVPDDPDVADIRDEAVTMLTRAGERAERTGAPPAAATAYSTAADLLQDLGTEETDLAMAALRERAGIAAATGGDPIAALKQHELAADLYRRHNQVRDAARASTRQAPLLRNLGRGEEAQRMLQQALAVLEVEPDADTVRAFHALARVGAAGGNVAEAYRLSGAALTLAQDLDISDAMLSDLLVHHGIAHNFANRPVQAVAYLREALRRAERAQHGYGIIGALLNLSDLLLTTETVAALEAARSAVAHARRLGNRDLLPDALCNEMQGLLLTGEWDEIEQAFAAATDGEASDVDPVVAYSVVLLRALRCDPTLEAVQPLMLPWLQSADGQDQAEGATALAAAAACAGDLLRASDLALQALTHTDDLPPSHDGIRWAWAIAADAALAVADLMEVTRLLHWLGDLPRGHLPPVLRAERLRIQARLLAAQEDPAAKPTFDAALQAFRDLGSPYHLAVGLLDFAEYLGHMADARSAEPLALEARTIAQGLRAKPLMERADAFAGPATALGYEYAAADQKPTTQPPIAQAGS